MGNEPTNQRPLQTRIQMYIVQKTKEKEWTYHSSDQQLQEDLIVVRQAAQIQKQSFLSTFYTKIDASI